MACLMSFAISVFPTLVGVFPGCMCGRPCSGCLPHARGGVSGRVRHGRPKGGSSPRSWGCFCWRRHPGPGWRVFPTLVGVFLLGQKARTIWSGLPHARGGVSSYRPTSSNARRSSPRSWGCFCHGQGRPDGIPVFPTLVGVFLRLGIALAPLVGLPHARGGVSTCSPPTGRKVLSSPRSWGCFLRPLILAAIPIVFPTLVGVFL